MDSVLFDPKILENIDFQPAECHYNPPINAINPGEDLVLRPLRISDYDNGFLENLEQLTDVGKVSKEMFEDSFKRMKSSDGLYYVIVIENLVSERVIASATLLIEQKFIHACGLRGRIEDVVVNSSYRGRQLGKLLIDALALLSKQLGCYKVTLDCRDEKRGFYESLGFKKEDGNSNFMQIRFH
ncbi:unnamed protein product [Nezara viridula]|uniref:Glucosamine 6-phosphate N-acetyltransferase n=1 Tax=Nezara viridula TaxID=85310 RepID=A0A9P0H389_NEZVI|nr:unnamed protein product [Nezara viridula]